MNKENQFTSTGIKLLHHPNVIQKLQIAKLATPVSVQIAPTSRCNLKCSFCSNVNRNRHEDLSDKRVRKIIEDCYSLGTKTVEWTGGGDPTQYEWINDVVWYASSFNCFKQGMISNGIAVKDNIEQRILDRLTWLRISMNCLDYVDSVDLPEFKGTLGFSYVMNSNTTQEVIGRLHELVLKYSPKYVRIVPNCQVSDEEQELNNILYSKTIAEWGEPYFYQAKVFQKPKNCYWGYFKPFFLHDGYVYRCSSVVLNDNADRHFHSRFRWCRIEEWAYMYQKIEPFNPEWCDHCVFCNQNNIVDDLLHPNGMEDFI
jgi:MoaA/NifB/PqqE/SkfB family radical SAM enzyme